MPADARSGWIFGHEGFGQGGGGNASDNGGACAQRLQ